MCLDFAQVPRDVVCFPFLSFRPRPTSCSNSSLTFPPRRPTLRGEGLIWLAFLNTMSLGFAFRGQCGWTHNMKGG